MLVVCERWVGDGDILTQVLSTIAALLPCLGLIAQPWVTEGPKPSVCCSFSIRHLAPKKLQLQLTQAVSAPGCIIVSRAPGSAVLPLIYTGASLDWRLGRGSVCYNGWAIQMRLSKKLKQSKFCKPISMNPFQKISDENVKCWGLVRTFGT